MLTGLPPPFASPFGRQQATEGVFRPQHKSPAVASRSRRSDRPARSGVSDRGSPEHPKMRRVWRMVWSIWVIQWARSL